MTSTPEHSAAPHAHPTLLIPGQGAQKVGMGADLYRASGAARRRFEAADDALGVHLRDLMFEGPSELLRHTEHLQPALVTLAVAEFDRLAELGVTPAAAIGHSVGQYAALVMADALSFEDAVCLVRARGRLMQSAVPVGVGTMALVMGLPRDQIRQLCAATKATLGIVQIACHNAPEQTVISGNRAAVEDALDRCEDAGAASVELNVSVPFHCALLSQVEAPFAELLADVAFRAPRLTVYDNVTARPLTTAEDIRAALVAQITAPVLFEESLRATLAANTTRFIQCGPGRGLAPLVRALFGDATFHYLQDIEDLRDTQRPGVVITHFGADS